MRIALLAGNETSNLKKRRNYDLDLERESLRLTFESVVDRPICDISTPPRTGRRRGLERARGGSSTRGTAGWAAATAGEEGADGSGRRWHGPQARSAGEGRGGRTEGEGRAE